MRHTKGLLLLELQTRADGSKQFTADSLSATIVWNPLYFHDLPIEANNS